MPTPLPAFDRVMPRASRVIAVALALVALTGVTAAPAKALSDADAEAMLVGWLNNDRKARGLVRFITWTRTTDIAGTRAGRMASTNTLSHTVGGDLGNQLEAAQVGWYRYGETIAWTSGGWSTDSVRRLYLSWKGSAPHWRLLMSDRFNYVGVGLAYRASNGRTYGSVVLTESPDHTGAWARVETGARSGDDVTWTWAGGDYVLQTHTAWFRDWDVQVRVDGGTWANLRTDTLTRSVTLRDRAHGHTFALRVRGTDRRGNVGGWSAPKSVTVP